jgi:uncharacterized protein YjbJ (UPF0337 family)
MRRKVSIRPFAMTGSRVAECQDTRYREDIMGISDKISNETQKVKGKAQEAAGDLTDDKKLQAKGKLNQAAAEVKQTGEKVKDAIKK